jgi:Na+(H+)/acetate symporter ActP
MYGLVTIGLAFALSTLPGSIASIFFSLMACVDGPICSIFLLSIFYSRSSTKGLVTGACCGMAVTVWLNIGSKLTDAPPFPRLPPGPTNQCFIYADKYFPMANITQILIPIENITSFISSQSTPSSSSSTAPDNGQQLTFLQNVYSISYIFFSFIGLMTSLFVGIIVSVFTKPPEHLNRRCMFSFKTHVLEEICGDRLDNTVDVSKNVKLDRNETLQFLEKDEEM